MIDVDNVCLRFVYIKGSSMIEEEYEALTENIHINSSQNTLPPLMGSSVFSQLM